MSLPGAPAAAATIRASRMPLPGTILAAFAVVSPLLPLLAERSMVALLSLFALAALVAHLALRRPLTMSGGRALFMAGGAVVAAGALSAAWALDGTLALKQAGQILGALVCMAVLWPVVAGLTAGEGRRISDALVLGVVLAMVVLGVNAAFDLPLHRLIHGIPADKAVPQHLMNKGIVTAVLLCWPAALALWLAGRRAWAVLLPLIMAALVLPLDTQTASFAILCAVAAAALLAAIGRPWLRIMAAGLVLLVFLQPVIVANLAAAGGIEADWMPSSFRHRVFIWDFVAQRIAERPLLGWGLEASRIMPSFGVEPPFGYRSVIPVHPHNAFLQVWLEMGLFGLVPVLVLVLLPLRAIAGLASAPRALAGGAWAAAVAAALPGYGAGQSWWLFTIVAQGMLVMAVLRPTNEARSQ